MYPKKSVPAKHGGILWIVEPMITPFVMTFGEVDKLMAVSSDPHPRDAFVKKEKEKEGFHRPHQIISCAISLA